MMRASGVEAVREHRGRPERGAGDERADGDPAGLGGDRAHHREHLERRSPGAVGAHAEEVVVGEHRVEAGDLGRGGDREHRFDLGAERREGEREAGHGSRVRASTAAPTSPASSPSRAGTMSTGGR